MYMRYEYCTEYTDEILRLTTAKFVFVITIFVCWSTLSVANDDYFNIEYYSNKLIQPLCNDNISLNISNAVISEIKQNFISSPIITCLNLMDNNIVNIEENAFNKLPNLTRLHLSNNQFSTTEDILKFGSRNKLQVLVMNNATATLNNSDYYNNCNSQLNIQIFGEYSNLEMLSLRKNCFRDLEFASFEYHTPYDVLRLNNMITFPKLKILDLSENNIRGTNFVKLLPNSLYFLDLHDNMLENLNLAKKGNELFALNLYGNNFGTINSNNTYRLALSMGGLKNLHYLSVSGNKIDTIDLYAFQNNDHLVFLNLSSNAINYLPSNIFANLQYLETVDLSSNHFEYVPSLSNKTEISTLYINNNQIDKIFSNNFLHMPKLVKLLIGENRIDEIDVNAFAKLTVLEKLDLSRNELSSLPKGWAEPLVSLKYLDLSENKFTLLESLSLTNTLPSIDVLYMANNQLKLNVKYFENLPQNLTIDFINRSNFTIWIYYNMNYDEGDDYLISV
ncbi:PREDICTED: leucine-rich repeat-containing protein let-4-like [Cyphomyrmex costatus]|uniref:leucine-rich repeat-containing protein let-4-like n=1 Tax=Cyphomyrmex costatus TaxID=456900 RepID=UPI0008523228|nr:PREDICTED: leucine-rich repeat-containing protein let-4-like [Cyphomyrmex costatus]